MRKKRDVVVLPLQHHVKSSMKLFEVMLESKIAIVGSWSWGCDGEDCARGVFHWAKRWSYLVVPMSVLGGEIEEMMAKRWQKLQRSKVVSVNARALNYYLLTEATMPFL